MSNPYATAAMLTRKYMIPDTGPRPIGKSPTLAAPYTPCPSKQRWGIYASIHPVAHAKKTEHYKRFFWRVHHRIGPGWDKLPEREVRKLLRQMSWRRVI